MWYGAILSLHISAAVLTVALIAWALRVALRAEAEKYRPAALFLAYAGGVGIASGTLLAFLSPSVSASGLAGHVLLYVGACAAAESVLFARMREWTPRTLGVTAAPLCASVALFLLTLSYGL